MGLTQMDGLDFNSYFEAQVIHFDSAVVAIVLGSNTSASVAPEDILDITDVRLRSNRLPLHLTFIRDVFIIKQPLGF